MSWCAIRVRLKGERTRKGTTDIETDDVQQGGRQASWLESSRWTVSNDGHGTRESMILKELSQATALHYAKERGTMERDTGCNLTEEDF